VLQRGGIGDVLGSVQRHGLEPSHRGPRRQPTSPVIVVGPVLVMVELASTRNRSRCQALLAAARQAPSCEKDARKAVKPRSAMLS